MPSASSELWRRLGSEGWEGKGITLSPVEGNAIRRKIGGALAVAEAEMVAAQEADFVVAMGLIGAMPSHKIGEVLANAVMEAYRIALLDLPGDLVVEAAHRALRDTKNEKGYRPPPNVLRRYVEADFDERTRRLRRLKAIAATPAPRQSPPPVFEQPQIAENFVDRAELLADTFAKIDAGTARMNGVQAEPASKPRGRMTWNDTDNDAMFGSGACPRVPFDDGIGPGEAIRNLARSRGLAMRDYPDTTDDFDARHYGR